MIDPVIFKKFNEGIRYSLEAQTHREEGRAEAAFEAMQRSVAAFDEVLALDPQHPQALSGKALELSQLGQLQEAIDLFRKSIELEPGFCENYRQLGLCLIEQGDVEGGREATLKALELRSSPDYRKTIVIEVYNFGGYTMTRAAGHRDAGRRQEELENYRRAKAVFELAQEISPGFEPAIRGLGIVCSCLGERDESARYRRMLGRKTGFITRVVDWFRRQR